MTRIVQDYKNEVEIWRDAWRIADPGAANPVAVARTLFAASAFLLHDIGTDGVQKHPALRVIAGQLSSMYSVDSAGADLADYDRVQTMVDKLEHHSDVCLTCGAYNDFPCIDEGAAGFRLMDHNGRPHTQERDFGDYSKVVEQ